MGMIYSTYHFYGAHVPADEWYCDHAWFEADRLRGVLKSLGLKDSTASLGVLTAGNYDRDMLFLIIRIKELSPVVQLGEFRLSQQLPVLPQWDRALSLAATAADYDPSKLVFGWVTVPDCS
jgi:hypothetical protein